MAEPPSIRFNNPGAINGNASWVKAFPGFQKTQVIGGGNPIAIMDTPEHGIALWWVLMQRYRAAGAKTVRQIIVRYGGGQANYEREYVPFVVKQSGLKADQEIHLDNDMILLPFAKAMFLMEAGKPTPYSDAQILAGIKFARAYKPGIKSEAGTAGAIVVTGVVAGVEAARRGMGWGTIIGIAVVFVVVAAIAFVVVKHLKQGE